MNRRWNLYCISESREVLMGIATLMVVFFHCFDIDFYSVISNSFIANNLTYIKETGNIGVDIFLFLSGIGLYFSFSKDSNINRFYKKRIVRVVPSFIIVASIYYLIKGVDVLSFIEGISLISFYINGLRDFWFFSLIIILYFLYPIFHKIIDEKGLKGLLYLLLITISSTLLIMILFPTYYDKIEIALTRIPVFLVGIYIGKKVFLKKEIPRLIILLSLIIFITCSNILTSYNFNNYICVRYIYCIYGITIVFLISYLHSIIKLIRINSILKYIGIYSMEIYLIFEKICLGMKKIKYFNICNSFLYYSLMFIITIILSIILKKLCNLIILKLDKKQLRKLYN